VAHIWAPRVSPTTSVNLQIETTSSSVFTECYHVIFHRVFTVGYGLGLLCGMGEVCCHSGSS